MLTAPRVGGIFSPRRTNLKLDSHGYSLSIRAKSVRAGAVLPSFELAAETLRLLAEVSVSGRHVGRLTDVIGAELVARRDERAEAHRTRLLGVQAPNAPSVVAVEVDGGRYQRRAEGQGCGARDPQWREDKVACLVTFASRTHDRDPQPGPPECFLERKHVGRLTQCPAAGGPEIVGASAEAKPDSRPTAIDWQPERLVRTCVATTRDRDEFGRLVGAEAKARNFESAARRAFLGDGPAHNGSIRTRWFARYVPVVDFIHVLGYVWQAARATGGSEGEQWERYARWVRVCWQGRVSEVLVELDHEQGRIGEPPEDAEATDPRVVLSRARGYSNDNADRMKYPEYRKAGLPVTRSWVESLIKEINYRINGSEKFWNQHGAESGRAVRAAALCDDERLAEHLAARPGYPFQRRIKAA
ncbi:MAG: LysR family transcriptional regulator [Planctomycetes bacterium]|nr:LysR family transcriptional regulator [Planctomycetota bacterium]